MSKIIFVFKMEVKRLSQREQHGFEERSAVEGKLQTNFGDWIPHGRGIGGIYSCQVGVGRLR